MKVIFVIGTGRCGSTILTNLLGEYTGLVSVGEISQLWELAQDEEHLCGCGNSIRECSFWRAVVREAFGRLERAEFARSQLLLSRHARTRHLIWRVGLVHGVRGAAEVRELSDRLAALYDAVARVSGCSVIVDSSKRPAYGHLIGQIPAIDLFPLHLVRDARAVAHSWLRHGYVPITGRPTRRRGMVASSLNWLGLNTVTEGLFRAGAHTGSYLRLRYEDFAAGPRQALEGVLSWAGESPQGSPFTDHHSVTLTEAHTVGGNRVRFNHGMTSIRADVEWQNAMAGWRKMIVAFMTWPLLVRYGYLT